MSGLGDRRHGPVDPIAQARCCGRGTGAVSPVRAVHTNLFDLPLEGIGWVIVSGELGYNPRLTGG